jgi:hypothetical protein
MSSSVKAEIVSSLFSKRSPEDGSLEETYIAHLKILDRDEKGPKPRYLLLACKPHPFLLRSLRLSRSFCLTTWPTGFLTYPAGHFLLSTASRSGEVFLHKSKRNSNNTFSIGKTWNLADVRAVEVFDVSPFSLPSAIVLLD